MKNLKIFSLFIFFSAFATVCFADDQLITQPIKVHVESPGSLSRQIGGKARLITNLTLTGDLNFSDLDYLGSMAAREYDYNIYIHGNLQYLDLSDANIVGGGSIHPYKDIWCEVKDNEIGTYMFACCKLVSVKLPKTTKLIDERAFYYCNNLKEIVIPDGEIKLGEGCFEGCTSLEKAPMPQNIETIPREAFRLCHSLKNIDIPQTVKKIEYDAFYECTGLISVNITDFNAWCDIDFGGYTSNPVYYAKHLYVNGEEIDNISVPLDRTYIKEFVFCGMESLKKVTLHSNFTSIGTCAFKGCKNISEIYVYAIKPPTGGSNFDDVVKQSCTLYVPRGTYMDYFLVAEWGDFLNIVEFDATGIDNPDLSCKPKPVDYYNINGMKTTKQTKGLNILRMSDGTYMKTSF